MKHQLPRFSVSMPGAKVQWPFGPTRHMRSGPKCPNCGAYSDGPHVHAADVDRPRKRICFGAPDFS